MSLTDPHAGKLSPSEFGAVCELLDRESAIQLSEGQEYLVETRLRPVVRDFGFHSLSDLIVALDYEPRLVAALVDAMTTNETLFFRDRHPFDTISDTLLPELIAAPRTAPISIWCAACSSGQEPYSLAMLLLDRFPDLVASRGIRIVATDISAAMIERAETGHYSRFEANRGLSEELLERHFSPDGNSWVVNPDLRSVIDFGTHNLMGSWSTIPRCEIVLMRNVLIYFTAAVKTRILGRIQAEVLTPGGALFLGSSETTISVDDSLQREQYGQTVLYRSL